MSKTEEYKKFIEGELSNMLTRNFAFARNTKTTRNAIEAMIKFHFEEKGLDLKSAHCNETMNTADIIDANEVNGSISFINEEGREVLIDFKIFNTGEISDNF